MAELFDDFEINRMPRWPRMTRLLALSVALHGLFIVAFVYVPTLRAVVRAAGSVAGIEFVEEDYTKSVIGQRATLVKLSEPYEKLYYPPDYFSPGAPLEADALLVQEAATAPPPIPQSPPFAMRRPWTPRVRTQPTPEPTPTPEELIADADATGDATAEPLPGGETKPEEPPKTDAEIEKVAAENKTPKLPRINTKPFSDLLAKGKEMVDKKEIDLNGVVEITVEADRKPDGTLENINVPNRTGTNEGLITLAEQFALALSDSKLMAVLTDVGHVTMTLKLDEETLSVNVASDVKTAERAQQMAVGYGMMLAIARRKEDAGDTGEIWKSVTLDSKGEQFIMNFKMTRATAGNLITKQIAKQQAAPKETTK